MLNKQLFLVSVVLYLVFSVSSMFTAWYGGVCREDGLW